MYIWITTASHSVMLDRHFGTSLSLYKWITGADGLKQESNQSHICRVRERPVIQISLLILLPNKLKNLVNAKE